MQRALWDGLETLTTFARFRYAPRPRSRAALEAAQERRLMRQLRWVLPRSAYYRERFARVGGDVRRWRELEPSDKAALMHGFSRLNTRGIDRDQALALALAADRSRDFVPKLQGLTVGLSSGTSGHRGLFLASQSENNQWAGVALAKMLPGSLRDVHRIALLHRANSHLYQGLGTGRLQFRYFDLLQPFEALLGALGAYQPTLLIGPPSALRLLADARARGALRLAETPARLISAAEVLEPADRRAIEHAFGARVDIAYVATEGFVASSCAQGGLHLNEDLLIVEMEWLDSAQRTFVPILTDLYRRVVPIVRYRLDDVLSLSDTPCACGSPHLTLDAIQGRADDVFRLGGVAVFPDFLRRAVLHASTEIGSYELVQTEADTIEVRLGLSARGLSQREHIQQALHAEIGRVCRALGAPIPQLRLQAELYRAEAITPGKVRRVRCELPPEA